jgi:putative ABC transport system permease protein
MRQLKYFKLLLESLAFALRAVAVNRLRTSLSLLGITIGIFAIISAFTVIDSLESNIRESLETFGENVIYIQKWPWTPEEGEEYEWWQYWNRPVPKMSEYEAIKDRSKYAEVVAFFAFANKRVEYENNNIDQVGIWGSTEEFPEIRDFELIRGRFPTSFEFSSGKNLAVIGYTIADKLFEGGNPIGKQIKVGGRKVFVIGVFEKEGNSVFGGGSMDEIILFPIKYLEKMVDIRRDNADPNIWVKAKPNITNEEMKNEIRSIMRSERRLKPRAKDTFSLNQTSMISQGLDQVFKVINRAGAFIGIFSILVGGFGIANIMFVSVKERTNQIGIQKALGAKRSFILSQFLFEAIVLALSGGVIGLLLIFGLTTLVTYLELLGSFKISLTAGNIILGLTISAAIGIISGFAPANSAAKMDPVNAINTTF